MRKPAHAGWLIEWSPGRVRLEEGGKASVHKTVAELKPQVAGMPGPGVALPRRLVFARTLHTPPVDRSEAEAVVRLQLESLFPVPPAELAHDFVAAGRAGPEGRPTGVYAVRAESIREAEAEIRSMGGRPEWFVPAAWGAVLLLRQAGHEEGVVVDQIGTETSFDIVRDGLLAHSRTAETGGDPARAATELARTLAAIEGAGLPVFACPGVSLPREAAALPTSTLAALRDYDGVELQLELPEARERQAKALASARRRFATLVWLAAAVLGTLAWLDRDEAAADARERAAKFTSQAERLQAVEQMAAERRKKLEGMAQLARVAQNPAQTPADVLRYVAGATPNNAWHTGLTFERGKPLQVRGTALNRDAVSAFADNLTASDRFRDVNIAYANEAEVEGQKVVQFSLTAHVVGNLPLIEKKPTARRSR